MIVGFVLVVIAISLIGSSDVLGGVFFWLDSAFRELDQPAKRWALERLSQEWRPERFSRYESGVFDRELDGGGIVENGFGPDKV